MKAVFPIFIFDYEIVQNIYNSGLFEQMNSIDVKLRDFFQIFKTIKIRKRHGKFGKYAFEI